jgi:hypothetical protein
MGFNEEREGNDKVLKTRNLSCGVYDDVWEKGGKFHWEYLKE